MGGGVDAKRSVVSKLGSWDNFENLRWEGSLPAEYPMSVFWAFGRRKGSCCKGK